jgi:hypothetical protein
MGIGKKGTKMITLERDNLVFRFPDLHQDAICGIALHRTLRIPDDGKEYPLPTGLGNFPLRHIDDYKHRLSERQLRRGGVIMPMHQAEAMWISFNSRMRYPFAVKIGTGKVNAVTGKSWSNSLNSDPQDYLIVPEQPWLDGYHVEENSIRQFVAMPLGEGYSVEEQLTGAAEHGGIQIAVMPMKADYYKKLITSRPNAVYSYSLGGMESRAMNTCEEMGLSAGGLMRQEIYDDIYGLDAWDQQAASKCFVTIANSNQWMKVTGETPPTVPPSAADYSRSGFPWFDYYDSDAKAIAAGKEFKTVKTVSEIGMKLGAEPLPENESILELNQIVIRRTKEDKGGAVREMVQ